MLNSLQAIRSFAALMVVAFHLSELLRYSIDNSMPVFSIGLGLLDVFFVMSGFVLYHITRDREPPGVFLLKRLARLVPFYWILTTAAVVVTFITPWFFLGANLTPEYVFTSYAFVPFPNTNGVIKPLLFVGWTLNYEILYIVIYSLTLYLPKPKRVPALTLIIGGVWLIGALMEPANRIVGFYGRPFLLELLLGCYLAILARRPVVERFAKATPMWILFVAGIVGATILSPMAFGTRNIWAYLLMVPASLIVMSGALQDMYRTPLKRNLFSIYADSGYSVYLIHPFVIEFVGIVTFKVLEPTWFAGAIITVLVFAGVMIISPFSLRYLELPSNNLVRDRIPWILRTPRAPRSAGE